MYCASEGTFLFSFVYVMYLNIASHLYGKQIKSILGNTLYLWMIFICVHLNLCYMCECRTMTLNVKHITHLQHAIYIWHFLFRFILHNQTTSNVFDTTKEISSTTINPTRIEPVGEPYREVCLSPWKGNWRISKNRIDWRNVLLSEKNYFHEKELKENGNMT